MKIKYLKSQITMLLIIGLVLLIVVSLILYLSKSVIKKQSQQGSKRAQETAFDVQPIKDFVSKCVDKLAKDAITLVGKQGGQIYKSQGGTYPDCNTEDVICREGNLFVNYYDPNTRVTYKVQYGIEAPQSTPNPEYYPSRTFPYLSDTSTSQVFEGFDGVVFGRDITTSLNYSGGSPNIQRQIESFIDNNMAACVNFSAFSKQGLEITLKSTRTSVVIGANDVSVSSIIPIEITNQKTKEFVQLNDFSTNVHARLKDVYFFMKDIADKETKNIQFNIRDIRNSRDLIRISVIENIYSKDDLIIITDEKSLINGRPFEYVFARKNRMPGLYYIKNNIFEYPTEDIDTQDLLNLYKQAEDPDEDFILFNIYLGESNNIALPTIKLDVPQIRFRIEASDGSLSDYQIITVKKAAT